MAADGSVGKELAGGGIAVGIGIGVGVGGGGGRPFRKLMPLLSTVNALISAKTPGAAPIAAMEPAMDVDAVAAAPAATPGLPLAGCLASAVAAACGTGTSATLPGAAAAVATVGCGTGTEGPPPPASGPLAVIADDGIVVAGGDGTLVSPATTAVATTSAVTGAVVASVPATGAAFCAVCPAGAAVATSPSLTTAAASATAFSIGAGATPTRSGIGGPGDDFSAAAAMPSLGWSPALRCGAGGGGTAVVVQVGADTAGGGGAVLLMAAFWHGDASTVGTVGVAVGTGSGGQLASGGSATGGDLRQRCEKRSWDYTLSSGNKQATRVRACVISALVYQV